MVSICQPVSTGHFCEPCLQRQFELCRRHDRASQNREHLLTDKPVAVVRLYRQLCVKFLLPVLTNQADADEMFGNRIGVFRINKDQHILSAWHPSISPHHVHTQLSHHMVTTESSLTTGR